jgi:hypothetical protein
LLFNRIAISRRPGGVTATIAIISGAIDIPTVPIAMIPIPSILNQTLTPKPPSGVIAIGEVTVGMMGVPRALVPILSILNQTLTSKPPSGVIAIVELTVGMIGVATVSVAMTPMPSVLMPTVSPQQTLCAPTFAGVVDG